MNAPSHAVASAHEALTVAVRQLADWAKRGQVRLLRDIIGNPFEPVDFDPAWLTPAVVTTARLIYDEQAFDDLPQLGDELRAAGCDHEGVLSHCHGHGPHVRGCWMIDSVLGKA
jgi:hypothetical protein